MKTSRGNSALSFIGALAVAAFVVVGMYHVQGASQVRTNNLPAAVMESAITTSVSQETSSDQKTTTVQRTLQKSPLATTAIQNLCHENYRTCLSSAASYPQGGFDCSANYYSCLGTEPPAFDPIGSIGSLVTSNDPNDDPQYDYVCNEVSVACGFYDNSVSDSDYNDCMDAAGCGGSSGSIISGDRPGNTDILPTLVGSDGSNDPQYDYICNEVSVACGFYDDSVSDSDYNDCMDAAGCGGSSGITVSGDRPGNINILPTLINSNGVTGVVSIPELGERADMVVGVKSALDSLGYIIGPLKTRIYNIELKNAITQFQTDENMPSSGALDRATILRLEEKTGLDLQAVSDVNSSKTTSSSTTGGVRLRFVQGLERIADLINSFFNK